MGMKETHTLPKEPQARMDYLREVYDFGPKQPGDQDAMSDDGNIFFSAEFIKDEDGHEHHSVHIIPIWPEDENGDNMVDWIPEGGGELIHQPPKGYLDKLKRHPDREYRWRNYFQK
jgi:hypothetical protein